MCHPKGFFTYDALLAFLICIFAFSICQQTAAWSIASDYARSASISKSTAVILLADYAVRLSASEECPSGAGCVVHHSLDLEKFGQMQQDLNDRDNSQANLHAYALYANFPPRASDGQYCARRDMESGGVPVRIWVCGT